MARKANPNSKFLQAQALVENGMTIKEACFKVGCTPQTYSAYSPENMAKTKARQTKYRAIRLIKSGRHSAGDIATRCSFKSTFQVTNLAKSLGIKCPTKADLDKAAKAKAKN